MSFAPEVCLEFFYHLGQSGLGDSQVLSCSSEVGLFGDLNKCG